jgi:hypothetical protein
MSKNKTLYDLIIMKMLKLSQLDFVRQDDPNYSKLIKELIIRIGEMGI